MGKFAAKKKRKMSPPDGSFPSQDLDTSLTAPDPNSSLIWVNSGSLLKNLAKIHEEEDCFLHDVTLTCFETENYHRQLALRYVA